MLFELWGQKVLGCLEILDFIANKNLDISPPEITFDKNLVSSNLLGNIDLQSNIKIHNYDTNKFTKFAVNDFNWNFRDLNFDSGLKSKLFGKIKNINSVISAKPTKKWEPKNKDKHSKPINPGKPNPGVLISINRPSIPRLINNGATTGLVRKRTNFSDQDSLNSTVL